MSKQAFFGTGVFFVLHYQREATRTRNRNSSYPFSRPSAPIQHKEKRLTTSAGNILDYEARTLFFLRPYKKGKKPRRRR
jgi:hypothetical protein